MKQNPFLNLPAGFPEIRELPDPFIGADGVRISDVSQWPGQRAYLLELLDHYMFGETPPPPAVILGEMMYHREAAEPPMAEERWRLTDERGLSIEAEVIRPKDAKACPVFVWNQFADMERCPIEAELIKRGCAVLSFDRTQFAPDQEGCETFSGGQFHTYYPEYTRARAVAIWGWGCSFCASWLREQEWAGPLIATGFSRGGKAALRAAAWDERFEVCVPACSGAGGGGCFRWQGGRLGEGIGLCESLGLMTRWDRFWYWYRDELAAFGGTDDVPGEEYRLPFDLHTLRALVAPRAILCIEGLDDTFANGFGTQITWRAAQEVYEFLGYPGRNALAFFEGGHEFSALRWRVVLDFCEVVLRGKPQELRYRRADGEHEIAPAIHFSWRAPEGRRSGRAGRRGAEEQAGPCVPECCPD